MSKDVSIELNVVVGRRSWVDIDVKAQRISGAGGEPCLLNVFDIRNRYGRPERPSLLETRRPDRLREM
jgi:hypothetical protein